MHGSQDSEIEFQKYPLLQLHTPSIGEIIIFGLPLQVIHFSSEATHYPHKGLHILHYLPFETYGELHSQVV